MLWGESVSLVCYNSHTESTKIYRVNDGLSTDLIYSIQPDKTGRLWVATPQGLSCFDPCLKRFVNYRSQDGLPATNCSANLYFDTLSNLMYAGESGKVIYFSLQALQHKEKPMKAELTGLLVNNRQATIPADRRVHLPWQSNDITLSFTGINLADGKENRYSYRLGNN